MSNLGHNVANHTRFALLDHLVLRHAATQGQMPPRADSQAVVALRSQRTPIENRWPGRGLGLIGRHGRSARAAPMDLLAGVVPEADRPVVGHGADTPPVARCDYGSLDG